MSEAIVELCTLSFTCIVDAKFVCGGFQSDRRKCFVALLDFLPVGSLADSRIFGYAFSKKE